MKTQPNKKKIRVQVITATHEEIDPEALWLNPQVEPEALIAQDPLDITTKMVEQAEAPELADFVLASLPPRRFSLRMEALELKTMKGEFQAQRESTEAFLRRLQGQGST